MKITRDNARAILAKLSEPFPADSIEWRIGTTHTESDDRGGCRVTSALAFAYVSRTSVMDRLDEVVGPENWQCRYMELAGGKGQVCGLSICIDGEWVEKCDGADNTDMEAIKGGISGSLKRAASVWGIGRYLYNLPKGWVIITTREGVPLDTQRHGTRSLGKPEYASGKDRRGNEYKFYWHPPKLPDWALPGAKQAERPVYAQEYKGPEAEEPEAAPEPYGTLNGVAVADLDGKLSAMREQRKPKGDYRILYDAVKRSPEHNNETRAYLLELIKGAVELEFADQQAAA